MGLGCAPEAGVLESAVRSKLWLIMRTPEFGEHGSKHGVYPRGDRNSLLIMGGPHAGDPLPLNDWGAESAQDMPEPMRDAIRAARAGGSGTLTDESWKQRLADRFGSRRRVFKLRGRKGGKLTMAATHAGSLPRTAKRVQRGTGGGGGGGGTGGQPNTGLKPGTVPAVQSRVPAAFRRTSWCVATRPARAWSRRGRPTIPTTPRVPCASMSTTPCSRTRSPTAGAVPRSPGRPDQRRGDRDVR